MSTKISLKFVPQGSVNNISSLVQIMALRRPGDKPLSEPITASLPAHTCVTRPQWVNYGSDVVNLAEYATINCAKKWLPISTNDGWSCELCHYTGVLISVTNCQPWPKFEEKVFASILVPVVSEIKEKSNPKTFATIMLIALHTMGIKCIALTRAERKISSWYHTMSVLYNYVLYMRGWFHIQNLDGVQRISEQGIKFVPNWNMKSVCSQWEYPALDKYMFNSHNGISHSR